jgi:hypothetical protein
MNKNVYFIFTIISILLFLYILIGFYDTRTLLLSSFLNLCYNIASATALLTYALGFFFMYKGKVNYIFFPLILTVITLSYVILNNSLTFTIFLIKLLIIPFILSLVGLYLNKSQIKKEIILIGLFLSLLFWIPLYYLKFENVYNLFIAVNLVLIGYYLAKSMILDAEKSATP